MNEADVVRLLQDYQHDIKNELQVIYGYLSMRKIDQVQTKLNQWINHFHKEQSLLMLQAPKFILWVIRFHHTYDPLYLSYHIHTNKNLQSIDDELVMTCKQLMHHVQHICLQSTKTYEITLEIHELTDYSIEMNILLPSVMRQYKALFKRILNDINHMYPTIQELDHGLLCQCLYYL